MQSTTDGPLTTKNTNGSLNACWSSSKYISLGHQNTSVDFVNDDIIVAFKQVLRLSLYGQNWLVIMSNSGTLPHGILNLNIIGHNELSSSW